MQGNNVLLHKKALRAGMQDVLRNIVTEVTACQRQSLTSRTLCSVTEITFYNIKIFREDHTAADITLPYLKIVQKNLNPV